MHSFQSLINLYKQIAQFQSKSNIILNTYYNNYNIKNLRIFRICCIYVSKMKSLSLYSLAYKVLELCDSSASIRVVHLYAGLTI